MANNINSKSIGLFIVVAIGLIFAIYTGNSISDGQLTVTAIVFGLLLLVVAVAGLGERLYLLMLICWGLTGSIWVLPIPLTVRQLVEVTASFLFISDLILSRNKMEKKNQRSYRFLGLAESGISRHCFCQESGRICLLGRRCSGRWKTLY